MPPEQFLSCDWGTSRFRLRLVETETCRILAEITSDSGVAKLAAEHPPETRPESYRHILFTGIAVLQSQTDCDLSRLSVMVSGMASSSLGWCELPYAKLPFALSGVKAVWKELGIHDPAGWFGDAYLLSGVCSDEDVMRGEETELMGAWRIAQSECPAGNGLVILPGTHSKHLEIRDSTLVAFRTYMTGELFDVVGHHSVLRHSLPQESVMSSATFSTEQATDRAGWMKPFLAGVAEGSSRSLSNALFLVRTRSLLSGMTPDESAAFLSGILIGAELSVFLTAKKDATPILLCSSGELGFRYQAALESLPIHRPLIVIPPIDVSRLAAIGQAALLSKIQGK